jgi:HEAT repeat protein
MNGDLVMRFIGSLIILAVVQGGDVTPVFRDDVEELIKMATGGNRAARLEAISKMAKIDEKRVVTALTALLTAEYPLDDEREEVWLHVSRSLQELGRISVAAESAIPQLESVANTPPRSKVFDPNFSCRGGWRPNYNYPYQARVAAECIRIARSGRLFDREIAQLQGHERIHYLVERAWLRKRGRENDFIHVHAERAITESGSAAVQAAIDSIGLAAKDAQLAILDYLKKVYARGQDPGCVAGFIRLTESQFAGVWQRALGVLREVSDPKAAAYLRTRLTSGGVPDPIFKHLAIEALGTHADEQTSAVLKGFLTDEEWGTAAAAAKALSNSGARAIPILIEGARSDNRTTRWACIWSLIESTDSRRLPVLREFLERYPDEDSDLLQRIRESLEGSQP